jgi:hypothetical protein
MLICHCYVTIGGAVLLVQQLSISSCNFMGIVLEVAQNLFNVDNLRT